MKFFKFNKIRAFWTLIIFLAINYFGKCNLYPCKVAAVIAKPVYRWSLCPLDFFGMPILGVSRLYFGLPFHYGRYIAIFLNLVIAYLIVSLVYYLYKKYKK